MSLSVTDPKRTQNVFFYLSLLFIGWLLLALSVLEATAIFSMVLISDGSSGIQFAREEGYKYNFICLRHLRSSTAVSNLKLVSLRLALSAHKVPSNISTMIFSFMSQFSHMVFILYGYSKIGAHLNSEISSLMRWRHVLRSAAIANLKSILEKVFLGSMTYHLI